ncbi:hypothetical protein [Streptomyces sp. NPDC012825]|uniref:hypothetical protein n=1 Tax=Streptomyces sp. NPDC012825 TaxID=3364851 RepID=UPI0036C89814
MDRAKNFHQPGSVITLMTAIVGLLASMSALWITLADRRRAIAKERREEAEAGRRAAAEEAAELAQSARLVAQEEMSQAKSVQLRLTSRSPAEDLGNAPKVWLVTVANRGPLPITNTQVVHTVGPAMPYHSDSFDLQGESTHEVELPGTGEQPRLAEVTTVFTDAAGRRWQRHLTGGLCLGTLEGDGTYQWDEPRFPETMVFPSYPPTPAVSRRRVYPALVVPLLVLVAIGCLLSILLR